MTTSSLFDPQAFLDSTEVSGEMATKRELCPAGRYNMQIKKYEAKQVTPEGKDPFVTFDVTMVVSGDQLSPDGVPLKEVTGMDENFARFSGYMDFTPNGALDLGKGKNVALGQLRAACNMNSSAPFKMPMLIGQVVSGEVFHRQDKKNPENFYAEVKNLMPL